MVEPHVLERTQFVPLPIERAFDFFDDPHNLKRITPAWLGLEIRHEGALTMREGLEIHYWIRPLFVRLRWTSRITRYHPPVAFEDEQIRGPYAFWRHRHSFRAVGDDSTEVTDFVEYGMPFGVFGDVAHSLFVRRRLEAIFSYRERAVDRILGQKSGAPPAWPPEPDNPW